MAAQWIDRGVSFTQMEAVISSSPVDLSFLHRRGKGLMHDQIRADCAGQDLRQPKKARLSEALTPMTCEPSDVEAPTPADEASHSEIGTPQSVVRHLDFSTLSGEPRKCGQLDLSTTVRALQPELDTLSPGRGENSAWASVASLPIFDVLPGGGIQGSAASSLQGGSNPLSLQIFDVLDDTFHMGPRMVFDDRDASDGDSVHSEWSTATTVAPYGINLLEEQPTNATVIVNIQKEDGSIVRESHSAEAVRQDILGQIQAEHDRVRSEHFG
jgi:hypothetical protein